MQFNVKFFSGRKSAIVKKHKVRCWEILWQVVRIESAQDQIRKLRENITISDKPDILGDEEEFVIKRDIEYHIENVYIRIVMIFDRCYLLVNDEFELGANSSGCNYRFLKERIKSEEIFKILEDWGNKIKQWDYRNFLMHEGRHIDPRLEEAFEKNFQLDFDIMGMYLSNDSEFCKQNKVRKKMKKENWKKLYQKTLK